MLSFVCFAGRTFDGNWNTEASPIKINGLVIQTPDTRLHTNAPFRKFRQQQKCEELIDQCVSGFCCKVRFICDQ